MGVPEKDFTAGLAETSGVATGAVTALDLSISLGTVVASGATAGVVGFISDGGVGTDPAAGAIGAATEGVTGAVGAGVGMTWGG